MLAAQDCGTVLGSISLVSESPDDVCVALLESVTVTRPVSPVTGRGVDVACSETVFVKLSPAAVGVPASGPPVKVLRIRARNVMVADPSCATEIGANTTVNVPSGFCVTDWYGSLGSVPGTGAQSSGAPLTWLVLESSGQRPLGTVSVTVMFDMSAYSPASICNV